MEEEFQSLTIRQFAEQEDVDLDETIYRLCTHDFLLALDQMEFSEKLNKKVLGKFSPNLISGKLQFKTSLDTEWFKAV